MDGGTSAQSHRNTPEELGPEIVDAETKGMTAEVKIA